MAKNSLTILIVIVIFWSGIFINKSGEQTVVLKVFQKPKIDSLLECVWKEKTKCSMFDYPLVVGNVVFPSLSEPYLIDAITGKKHKFGSPGAISLLSKNQVDSFLCCSRVLDTFVVTNIYKNKVLLKIKSFNFTDNNEPKLVKSNLLCYPQDYELKLMDLNTSNVIWTSKFEHKIFYWPIEYKNILIAGDKRQICFIDKNAGKRLYSKSLFYESNFIINNDQIYFATKDSILKINLENGKKTCLFWVQNGADRLTFENHILYFSSGDELMGFSLNNNKVTFRKDCQSFNTLIRKFDKYLFGSAESGPPMEDGINKICSSETGELLYEYFPINEHSPFGGGEQALYWAESRTTNGLLIACARDWVYAFRFRKK